MSHELTAFPEGQTLYVRCSCSKDFFVGYFDSLTLEQFETFAREHRSQS